MMWTTNVVFLCLLTVAVPAPTRRQSYEKFMYSTSVEVENRDEAKLECSITLPAGGKLKWYRQRSDTKELVDIADDYWKKQGAEYMITVGSNNQDHYYMSKLSIRVTKESYAGIYFCVAEGNDGTQLTQSDGIPLTVLGVNKECQEPHVTGFSAQWVDHENFTTNVQWTVEPELKSDWCKGNKLIWSIRYIKWCSIDKVPDDLSTIDRDSDAWSKWMPLEKRQTQINIDGLDKTKYYLFEIGRRIKHKDYIEHKYPSKVFYFGQQVGATIIQAKDVQVKVGQDATITCIADGLPKPKVIWTVALGDSSSISSPTRSDIEPVAPVTKQFSIKDIVNSHEKKYTCLARNTIIKDGVKTRVIDTATIRLEVKDNLID